MQSNYVNEPKNASNYFQMIYELSHGSYYENRNKELREKYEGMPHWTPISNGEFRFQAGNIKLKN